MISVVMTTYNGERYILEQLESIRIQTRQPDEVIIQDDASDDDTQRLIDHFIEVHGLGNWKVYRNVKNIGWRNNFYDAISKSHGDIIFFADQDDIWHPQKIKTMCELFIHNGMEALYTEKKIIDENGGPDEDRMEKNVFSRRLAKIPFSCSFYTAKTLGCCMCVSRRIVDFYLELNCPECGHDSQCGRLALLCDGLWHLDDALIDYRIHAANSSGISRKASYGQASLEKRKKDLENDINWIEKILCESAGNHVCMLDEIKRNMVRRSQNAMKVRYQYLSGKKKVTMFSLIKYADCYSGIGMLIGDWAYRRGMNEKIGLVRWKIKKMTGI